MNPLGEEAKRSDPAAVATSELSDGDRLQLFCAKIQEDCGLSARELDVLRLLVHGYSSACIQKELYIAAGTVNYHTRNIYAKLGVHSKQEIIELYRDRS